MSSEDATMLIASLYKPRTLSYSDIKDTTTHSLFGD